MWVAGVNYRLGKDIVLKADYTRRTIAGGAFRSENEFAIGQALQMGNNFTVALGHLPEDRKADGNAVINTMQQLFGAMGTSVISGVVAASHTCRKE